MVWMATQKRARLVTRSATQSLLKWLVTVGVARIPSSNTIQYKCPGYVLQDLLRRRFRNIRTIALFIWFRRPLRLHVQFYRWRIQLLQRHLCMFFRILGGIVTHVSYRGFRTMIFRFVSSACVRSGILISSPDGCSPVYWDSILYPILPDGHRVGSFRQFLVRTGGLRLNLGQWLTN